MAGAAPPIGGLSTRRIEAFSDGVFSIVITLLVLEIRVPQLPHTAVDLHLLPSLFALWPKILSFVISFVIVGIFWVSHHQAFHLIQRTNRPLLWLNLLYLLCVAFIPFPTALMGEYVGTPIAVVPYGLTLIATGLAHLWLWRYATHRHRLVAHDLDPALIRMATHRILIGPALYAAAILVSVISARLTLFMYAVIPVYYLLPHRLDTHLARHLSRAAARD